MGLIRECPLFYFAFQAVVYSYDTLRLNEQFQSQDKLYSMCELRLVYDSNLLSQLIWVLYHIWHRSSFMKAESCWSHRAMKRNISCSQNKSSE
jgi:hypothetical protein